MMYEKPDDWRRVGVRDFRSHDCDDECANRVTGQKDVFLSKYWTQIGSDREGGEERRRLHVNWKGDGWVFVYCISLRKRFKFRWTFSDVLLINSKKTTNTFREEEWRGEEREGEREGEGEEEEEEEREGEKREGEDVVREGERESKRKRTTTKEGKSDMKSDSGLVYRFVE
jgi:hypothetical protein